MTNFNRGGTNIYKKSEDIYSKAISVYIYLYYSPCFKCLTFFEKVMEKYKRLTIHFYFSKEYTNISSNYLEARYSPVLSDLFSFRRYIPFGELSKRYNKILSNDFRLFSGRLIFHTSFLIKSQNKIYDRLSRKFLE